MCRTDKRPPLIKWANQTHRRIDAVACSPYQCDSTKHETAYLPYFHMQPSTLHTGFKVDFINMRRSYITLCSDLSDLFHKIICTPFTQWNILPLLCGNKAHYSATGYNWEPMEAKVLSTRAFQASPKWGPVWAT